MNPIKHVLSIAVLLHWSQLIGMLCSNQVHSENVNNSDNHLDIIQFM